MKNILFIVLLFCVKASSQVAFPNYVPTTADSIRFLGNVNGAPRMIMGRDIIKSKLNVTDTVNKWLSKTTVIPAAIDTTPLHNQIATNSTSITTNTAAITAKLNATDTQYLRRDINTNTAAIAAGVKYSFTSLRNGDYVKYDSGNNQWVNTTAPTSTTSTAQRYDSIARFSAIPTTAAGSMFFNTSDDKLYIRNLTGNYWLRFSSTDSVPAISSTYDLDAASYFNRVESAGGTITTARKDAINTFVQSLKSNNIYTGLTDFGLFIGGTAASHAISFKGLKTLGFVGSWTHDGSGSTPAATNTSYITTGIIPANDLSLNSTSLSIYTAFTPPAGSRDWFGVSQTTTSTHRLYISSDASGFLGELGASAQRATGTITATKGFFTISRTSSTQLDIYQNGVNKGSSTAAQTGTLATIDLYLDAIHGNGTNTSPLNYTNSNLGFWAYGTGRTSSQEATLYNAINTLMTAIGR